MSAVSIYESGEYLENNPDWHAADAPYKAGWISDILHKNEIEPDHLVEIGCGSGEILVGMQKIWPEALFEGYEISSNAYSIAEQKAGQKLKFHLADYLETQTSRPKTSRPNVLMAIDVFEHVEDYMSFIRKMRSLAEWKIFHIPLDLSVQGLLRSTPLLHSREIVGHLHYFFKDTALATLRDCGYEIVDWNYTHGAETLENRKLRTKALALPRKLFRSISEDLAVRVMGGASIMVLAR